MELILSPKSSRSVKEILNRIGIFQPSCAHFEALGSRTWEVKHSSASDIPSSFSNLIPIQFSCFDNFNFYVHFVSRREWAILRFEKYGNKFRCLSCQASHRCQHWRAEPTSDVEDGKSQNEEDGHPVSKFDEDLRMITENGFLKVSSHSTKPFPSYSPEQKSKIASRMVSISSICGGTTFICVFDQFTRVISWAFSHQARKKCGRQQLNKNQC